MHAAQMDRLKGGFASLARGADPRRAYRHIYRAKLVHQNPTNLSRVDVVPDHDDLPAMSNIPLKVGIPGVTVTLNPGEYVHVGWEDGDPDNPYATCWLNGSPRTVKTMVDGAAIELGSLATQPLIWGTIFITAIKAWITAQQANNVAITAGFAALAAHPALTAISGVLGGVASPGGAMVGATTAFKGGAYLSAKVKTE